MADFLTYTSNYLKENGLINANVDQALVTPIIKLVQKKYLLPILGTDLFEDLKSEIIDGSVSAKYVTLLDEYISDIMLYYVLHESTPAVKYRYMNKGVVVKSGDNTTAADLTEIKFLMDSWKNNAEMFAERLTRYLKDHTEDYPLYDENTDCYKIKPNKSNYTTSIYLGDSDISEKEAYNIKIGNYE